MAIRDLFKSSRKPAAPVSEQKSTLPEAPGLYKEDFTVSGVDYCLNGVMRLTKEQPEWTLPAEKIIADGGAGSKIYRYSFTFKPVELVPEPMNPHDKNAVIVRIAGEKVGYIGKENNVHVSEILKSGSIKYITASVRGGPYKVVALGGSEAKQEDRIHINIRIAYSV